MSRPDHYPAGVPCWIETLQPDPRAALDFYGALLGWEFAAAGPMPGGLAGEYVVAQLEGRAVAGVGTLPDLLGPGMAAWTTYVCVEDVDAAVEGATAAGATRLVGPVDAADDGRLAVLVDPAGAVVGVWEARGRHGAALVNEPGAWTMSSLHTADPDGAATFYGAVFGWVSQPMGPGAPVTFFRLPGYLGGEPDQPVPRDVVAVMAGTGSEPGGTPVPTHWNVNLRVADTDAVAARAVELGGTVLVAPMDTPGFRNAVVLDPQGAAFSVSQVLAPSATG